MSHWDKCEACKEEGPPGTVHVYGQYSWHEEAYIVADEKGLMKLKEAIEKALAEGFGKAVVSPADGEGYHLHVIRHDTDRMDRLILPYVGWEKQVGAPRRGRPPHSLVPDDADDEILGDDEYEAVMKKFDAEA